MRIHTFTIHLKSTGCQEGDTYRIAAPSGRIAVETVMGILEAEADRIIERTVFARGPLDAGGYLTGIFTYGDDCPTRYTYDVEAQALEPAAAIR